MIKFSNQEEPSLFEDPKSVHISLISLISGQSSLASDFTEISYVRMH